jgi:hypothetical protein
MQTESPYKTINIREGKQFLKCGFNLKTKLRKSMGGEKTLR